MLFKQKQRKSDLMKKHCLIKQIRYLFESGTSLKNGQSGVYMHSESSARWADSLLEMITWTSLSGRAPVHSLVFSALYSENTRYHTLQSHIYLLCNTNTLTHVEAIDLISRLHANGSVQSDDFPVDHGVLRQWRHQVGKLGGVSKARGEGHLSGEEGAHLLR